MDTIDLTKESKIEDIYHEYIKIDAKLIAQIEVYEHDLHKSIVKMISDLFQSVSMIGAAEDEVSRNACLTYANDYSYFFTQKLYRRLIKLYIKKICQYKISFLRFNYHGVRLKDSNGVYGEYFHVAVHNKILKASDNYLRELVKYFSSMSGFSSFDLKKIKNVDFKNSCSEIEQILKLYENVYPEVINNGSNKSFIWKVLNLIFTYIIPVFLTVTTIKVIIENL